MAKKKNASIRICVDRPMPIQYWGRAAEVAIKENPRNAPPQSPMHSAFGGHVHPARMALETKKKWSKGRVLGVRFMDGTKLQKQKAQQFAEEWSQFANIGFKFDAGSSADLRVSFHFDPGSSWSAIGTDCLVTEAFPKNEPTMNFGWLDASSDDTEWRRVVTHEFGHALGAIHEHQNPKGGIKWNLPAVYAYFGGPPNNWSKQDTDFNVVQKYSLSQLNATKFDIHSIMLYSFPPELTIGGNGTPENTDLSTGDKKFIRRMYPKT
jgi:hypothetical protein